MPNEHNKYGIFIGTHPILKGCIRDNTVWLRSLSGSRTGTHLAAGSVGSEGALAQL